MQEQQLQVYQAPQTYQDYQASQASQAPYANASQNRPTYTMYAPHVFNDVNDVNGQYNCASVSMARYLGVPVSSLQTDQGAPQLPDLSNAAQTANYAQERMRTWAEMNGHSKPDTQGFSGQRLDPQQLPFSNTDPYLVFYERDRVRHCVVKQGTKYFDYQKNPGGSDYFANQRARDVTQTVNDENTRVYLWMGWQQAIQPSDFCYPQSG